MSETNRFCPYCGVPAKPGIVKTPVISDPNTANINDPPPPDDPFTTDPSTASFNIPPPPETPTPVSINIPQSTDPSTIDPIVIVIHGIGGGERSQGWSKDVEQNWGIGKLKEATFSYEGRTNFDSYTDFLEKTGEWARKVRNQIRKIVQDNPDRSLMIVSHSWGTVATKMALMGGRGPDEIVAGINEPGAGGLFGEIKVDKWITLGSPLGTVEKDRMTKITVATGKPRCVKDWTNMYDSLDPVSTESHKLRGAKNIKVAGPKTLLGEIIRDFDDPVGIKAHTGIWTHTDVKKKVVDSFNMLIRVVGYLPDEVTGTLVITGMQGGPVPTTHRIRLIKTGEDSTHYFGRIEERSIPKGNSVVIEKAENVLTLTYKLRGPFAPKVQCKSSPTIKGHYAGLMKSLNRKNVPQVQIGTFVLTLDI